jgi:hypothetical protein
MGAFTFFTLTIFKTHALHYHGLCVSRIFLSCVFIFDKCVYIIWRDDMKAIWQL